MLNFVLGTSYNHKLTNLIRSYYFLLFVGKVTRLINTNVILPGTQYVIEIRSLYKFGVKSEPAVVFVTTGRPKQ